MSSYNCKKTFLGGRGREYKRERGQGKALVQDNPVSLKLGDLTSYFSNGDWNHDIDKEPEKEVIALRKANRKLEREKNALQVRNDILLDMLTIKSLKLEALQEGVHKSIKQKSKSNHQ
jgi:hypothetical protein